jgi:TatD DNase family protein
VFRGVYHGKRAHPDDLADIVARARDAGVEKMMVTGSDLKESKNAIKVARENGVLGLRRTSVSKANLAQ